MRGAGFFRRVPDKPWTREKQLLRWFDVDEGDMEHSRALDPFATASGARILIPRFTHPYGGVYTALRLADAINRAGSRARLCVYDDPHFDARGALKQLNGALSTIDSGSFVPFTRDSDEGEAVLCTFWPSAYHALSDRGAVRKVYLIQDMEPLFYPAGTEYALCENTYRFPMHRLVNTVGLKDRIVSDYPESRFDTYFFTPSADERYGFSERPPAPPTRLLVYARPDAPRNAFSLCAAFCAELKKRHGSNVEITTAGAHLDRADREAFSNSATFADVVPYERLPEFYSEFHVVMALMLTKHPSYIPIEAMATGALVLANENRANRWLLKDGENCVTAMPAIKPLISAFERGTQPITYEKLTKNAAKTVRATNWKQEAERAGAFILGRP